MIKLQPRNTLCGLFTFAYFSFTAVLMLTVRIPLKLVRKVVVVVVVVVVIVVVVVVREEKKDRYR